jgi:ATP-binding cassette subfamily B protein
LVGGGAIGESLEESQEEKQIEKLEVIAKNIGGGV